MKLLNDRRAHRHAQRRESRRRNDQGAEKKEAPSLVHHEVGA
jgi:hypothetical protein